MALALTDRLSAGIGCPELLLMSMDNSLVNHKKGKPICDLTFFVPYWVDNRTSLDLVLRDHESAPRQPLLLGLRNPQGYSEVRAPCEPLSSLF